MIALIVTRFYIVLDGRNLRRFNERSRTFTELNAVERNLCDAGFYQISEETYECHECHLVVDREDYDMEGSDGWRIHVR